MNYNFDKLKELNPDSIKKADPKDYILLLAHSLRLGALYKAKFFVWMANNNYELLEQDTEALEYLLKETIAIHKKASNEIAETNIDYLDNIFYLTLKNLGKFSEADCISLSLVLLSYISYKSELIENEEYLEIRDWLVPYKIMVSQSKLKAEELYNQYKTTICERPEDVKLLSKLGKGISMPYPDDNLILEAFKEITYDAESWEKE